jgi:MOSC domain-containing protein
MPSASGSVRNLYFYPVKGLSPQPLTAVNLAPAEGFPFDRMFGLACFDSGFDPRNPRPLPKQRFLMLARDNRLAELQTHLDPDTRHFTIHVKGELVHESDFSDDGSVEKTRDWFAEMFGLGPERRPVLAEAAPHRFTDVSVGSARLMNAISLINLSSVADFSERLGKPIDPLRFRGNLYFEGWPPFSELELMNAELSVGSTRLRILRRTTRCAATEVNPKTGQRDIAVPRLLKECYGHVDMGVYAEVLAGGVVEPGMPVVIRD